MEEAQRLKTLSGGIFSEIDKLAKGLINSGVDIINFSIGSPDLAPPLSFCKDLSQYVLDTKNYGYALTDGIYEFRKAVADWYFKRDKTVLDPNNEILPLLGSQDGLSHIYWSFLNKDDIALIADPGYPIYSSGVLIAEGIPYSMPLYSENGYLPDLAQIPKDIAQKAKIMVLNYPSNPLAVTASEDFFQEVVKFAKENNIVVCHDFAYSELAFDGYKPISFLSIPGAKDVGVEFHSTSKMLNLAGCRLGFVVGNREIIDCLKKIKTNIDFGGFKPILMAGAKALNECDNFIKANAHIYQKRRDLMIDGLEKIGWKIPRPKASMYIWAEIPGKNKSSIQFTKLLAEETGVIVIPGLAFGKQGEGYVRFCLVQPEERIIEAVRRISDKFSNLV